MADAMLYRLAENGDKGPPFALRASRFTITEGDDWANVKVLDLAFGGTLSVTLDRETVPDLLAVMFCQLDPTVDHGHEHDGATCVPSWIRLGED